MLSTVSKTKPNTCVLNWLRSRAPKDDSNSLGFALFCVPFWWLRQFCLSCDSGHLDLNLNPFYDYFIPLNIHTKYVYLVKDVSKPVSFNWIFFFFFVKHILNYDFSINTTLSHFSIQRCWFLGSGPFPFFSFSILSWPTFILAIKLNLCIYCNPSFSG